MTFPYDASRAHQAWKKLCQSKGISSRRTVLQSRKYVRIMFLGKDGESCLISLSFQQGRCVFSKCKSDRCCSRRSRRVKKQTPSHAMQSKITASSTTALCHTNHPILHSTRSRVITRRRRPGQGVVRLDHLPCGLVSDRRRAQNFSIMLRSVRKTRAFSSLNGQELPSQRYFASARARKIAAQSSSAEASRSASGHRPCLERAFI